MPYLSVTRVPSSGCNSSPAVSPQAQTSPTFSLGTGRRFFSPHSNVAGYLDPYLELGHPARLEELKFLLTQRSRKTREGSGCWEDSNPRERFMNNKPLTGLLSELGGLPQRNWISKSGMDFSWLGERRYICFQKALSLEVKGRAVPHFSQRIPSDPAAGKCLRQLLFWAKNGGAKDVALCWIKCAHVFGTQVLACEISSRCEELLGAHRFSLLSYRDMLANNE